MTARIITTTIVVKDVDVVDCHLQTPLDVDNSAGTDVGVSGSACIGSLVAFFCEGGTDGGRLICVVGIAIGD